MSRLIFCRLPPKDFDQRVRLADDDFDKATVFPNSFLVVELERICTGHEKIFIDDRDEIFLQSSKLDALAAYCLDRNRRGQPPVELLYFNDRA